MASTISTTQGSPLTASRTLPRLVLPIRTTTTPATAITAIFSRVMLTGGATSPLTRRRAERAALDVVDDVALQPDHAAHADVPGGVDQVQEQAGQAEGSGQRDHERRQPEPGDDEPLQRPVGGGPCQREQQRGPPRPAQRQRP